MDIFADDSDKLVYTGHTGMQRVRVFDKRTGFRYMTLDGVQQGGMLISNPERLVLPYFKNAFGALMFTEDPTDCLFVGLGMGAMPTFMRSVLPDTVLDVVEIDPGVVDLAEGWFGLKRGRMLNVTVGDGREFIRKSAKKYDIVFLDAYRDATVPSHLATAEFMEEVKAVLKPGGVAVSNLWGSTINHVFGHSVMTLKAAFAHLYQFRSYTNNIIFIGDTNQEMVPLAELLHRAKRLNKTIKPGFDMVEILKRNFKCVDDETFFGEVLRD